MTLEQMGYRLEGQAFVKRIGRYKITLFPSGKDFIRRIIKDNKVIDMRKSTLANLESDETFLEVLKNRELAVQQYPTIIPTAKTEQIVNTEIHMRELASEVSTPKQTLASEVSTPKQTLASEVSTPKQTLVSEVSTPKQTLKDEVRLRK